MLTRKYPFAKFYFYISIFIFITISGCNNRDISKDPDKVIIVGQSRELQASATKITISYPVSNVWSSNYLPYIFDIELTNVVTESQANEFLNENDHTGALFFEMDEIVKDEFRGKGKLIGYGKYPSGRFNPFTLMDIDDTNLHRFSE